jgi:hypothetical protein
MRNTRQRYMPANTKQVAKAPAARCVNRSTTPTRHLGLMVHHLPTSSCLPCMCTPAQSLQMHYPPVFSAPPDRGCSLTLLWLEPACFKTPSVIPDEARSVHVAQGERVYSQHEQFYGPMALFSDMQLVAQVCIKRSRSASKSTAAPAHIGRHA